eukprot:s6528_g4.t1
MMFITLFDDDGGADDGCDDAAAAAAGAGGAGDGFVMMAVLIVLMMMATAKMIMWWLMVMTTMMPVMPVMVVVMVATNFASITKTVPLRVRLKLGCRVSSIERDRVSYYTAIQACETCGEWSSALLLLQSLVISGVRDHLGADSLDRRTYVHAFQAGDPIDCFKHVVYLSLSQVLMASEDPLTIVDCHAGSGIYDFRGLAPGFHRNFEDGIFHLLSGNGVPEGRDALTPAVCQYLEIQRRINRKASPGGRPELDLFAGSAVLAAQVLLFEASPVVYGDLVQNLGNLAGSFPLDGIQTFCDDSYRRLLQADAALFRGRGYALGT